jgi:hypothetical protein
MVAGYAGGGGIISELGFPEEIRIDLAGPNQILELFQAGKWPELEILTGEIDPLEEFVELACSLGDIPFTEEIRQVL